MLFFSGTKCEIFLGGEKTEKIREDQSTNCFPFNADENPKFGEMSKSHKKNGKHIIFLLKLTFLVKSRSSDESIEKAHTFQRFLRTAEIGKGQNRNDLLCHSSVLCSAVL